VTIVQLVPPADADPSLYTVPLRHSGHRRLLCAPPGRGPSRQFTAPYDSPVLPLSTPTFTLRTRRGSRSMARTRASARGSAHPSASARTEMLNSQLIFRIESGCSSGFAPTGAATTRSRRGVMRHGLGCPRRRPEPKRVASSSRLSSEPGPPLPAPRSAPRGKPRYSSAPSRSIRTPADHTSSNASSTDREPCRGSENHPHCSRASR